MFVSRILGHLRPLIPATTGARFTSTDAIKQVNSVLDKNAEGRLFAVVHLAGKQFKVTAGDLICLEGYWPPTAGDQIRLDKILLAGGKDFSLIGTPTLRPGLVDVQATVIEKTRTHTKTHFKKKPHVQFIRWNFQKPPRTVIRINSIEVVDKVKDQGPTIDPIRVFE